MNNRFTKTVAATLLAALVLTTCVAAQTAPARDNITTAAALARALNAMNEGSARVSGDTVTLTKNVGVERDLTVATGVTLTLTEDGGVYLMNNGLTLTVNGTLNVPHNGKLGIDSRARKIIINGSGTINLTSKGRLLHIDNGRKLTLDGVTLVGIADNDSSLVVVEASLPS